jgi:hypothetical protein
VELTHVAGRSNVQHMVTQNVLGNAHIVTFLVNSMYYCFLVGHAVAQLVEALRYKSEGRRFDSRWCQLNFSLT